MTSHPGSDDDLRLGPRHVTRGPAHHDRKDTECHSWDLLLAMLWLFFFIAWIWLVIFIDIFRSDDLSGWGKA